MRSHSIRKYRTLLLVLGLAACMLALGGCSLSDKADESTEMSYEAFEAKAAEHCASLVEHMVRSF